MPNLAALTGLERNGTVCGGRRPRPAPRPGATGTPPPSKVRPRPPAARRPPPAHPAGGPGRDPPRPEGDMRGGRSGGLTALPASPGKGCYPPGSHSQACPWSEKKERILGVLKGPRDLIGGCFDLIETLACNQIAFPSQATGRSQGAGCPQPPRGSRAQSPPGGSATRRPPTGPQGRRRGHLGGTASHPPAPPPRRTSEAGGEGAAPAAGRGGGRRRRRR